MLIKNLHLVILVACRTEAPMPLPQFDCPDAAELIEAASNKSSFYNVACEGQHMRIALGSEETILGASNEIYDSHEMFCVEYFRLNDMKSLNTFLYSRMYLHYAGTLSGQIYFKNMHDRIREDKSQVISYISGFNHVSTLSTFLNHPGKVGPLVFGTAVDCDKFTATRAVVLFVDQHFDPRAFFEKLLTFKDEKIVIVSVANNADIEQIYKFNQYSE